MHFFPVRASLLCLNTSSSSLPVIHIRHAVHTPYTCTLGARGVGTAAPLPHSRRAVSAPTWRGSGRWWAGQRRGEEITCKITNNMHEKVPYDDENNEIEFLTY